MATRSHDPSRSSVALGGGRRPERRRPMWLPAAVALAGLALEALVVALLSFTGGSGTDTTGAVAVHKDLSNTPPATPRDPQTQTTADASATGAGTTGADAGTIADHVGDDARGSDLRVLSVADSGFFVGTSDEDRQFVEYAGDVGVDEAAQSLPRVGDTVSLQGPGRPAPEDPARTLELEGADARLVEDRGAYINAETVRAASS